MPALGRLVIYTKKIDEMARFYSEHFDFSVLRNEDDRIVELRPITSGATLLLHPATAKQKEGQALVKLVFDVPDVPSFCEAARSKGLEFGRLHSVGRYVFANTKDPSNNAVQISSRAFIE